MCPGWYTDFLLHPANFCYARYLRIHVMTVSNGDIMIWIHLSELFSRIENHNKTESWHQIAHLTVISMFVHGRLIK